ncbi:uncharacterized protein TRUGW13939_08197 [Talaromyces rugulosus]|uniref:NmrA-like domain-containing protein n=1 Tax=Talaromyces rugulosus TaxID=121627 RepID=A0A7H8R5T2_TALRU|nr:uncharacterized protein TRUGW13939_08197 [Talaromyces rugulosus]QKX61051.1 hypothetical protein TRUGW13939_08197 [Talaromyces rugulosus]
MVKIAVAGGSGAVAQEVIEALIATKKHEILILSRQEPPTRSQSEVSWAHVDYNSVDQLVTVLNGFDVLLSFIVVLTDPGNVAQKNLIHAAIQAGIKRFAPSEWATSSVDYMPWYGGKAEVHDYLVELNKTEKVLEYCLFQPGMFTDYLVHPYNSAKHFRSFETQFDFYNRRVLVREEGLGDVVTFTTLEDFANIVVKAVEYQGEWPTVGGIRGTDISIGELIALGEKVRGAPFNVETLSTQDLKVEKIQSTWRPKVDHPSMPPEQTDALAGKLLSGVLLAISAGAFQVSDEWNRLLPDYQFTGADDFLSRFWQDKL